MTKEFVLKTIRYFIIGFLFLGLTSIVGVDTREAHQFFYMLGIMVITGLILRNIWLTMFLWWTVFLYSFFKFNVGQIYVTNIFFGCILYYLTKLAFKKEHIDAFLNGFMWLVAMTCGYMILQVLNFDFIYKMGMHSTRGFGGYFDNSDPAGFFGFKACMGVIMTMAIPVFATRKDKRAIWFCLVLFVPIYISRSSICMAGGIITWLFVLWYKVRRRDFWLISSAIVTLGVLYVVFVDMPMGTLPDRLYLWKLTLRDCIIHPISGWGLDSFRGYTELKKHVYVMNMTPLPNGVGYNIWDNPHNLYVSLFFEWGILGLIFLGGYLRQCGIWFHKSIKSPNTLAIGGLLLAFFCVSFAQFPMFLARCAVIIIPCFGLYEIQCRD